MNNKINCEICNKPYIFDGKYRMGSLVCKLCEKINKEYLREYWKGSITSQLNKKEVKSPCYCDYIYHANGC